MMSNDPLTLSSGDLELQLSPSIGGAISKFAWTGEGGSRPVLRECHSPLENVLDAACFPLVPFVNRIRGGCFDFRGGTVRLTPNMAGDPSPLHGQGWLNAWQVGEAGSSAATLGYSHEPGEWPWAYEARQEFKLEANALHLRLACTNRSGELMPCGLGFHPYFQCGAGTRIQTDVEVVWAVDENVLPVARMPAVGRYAIGDDPVCGRGLDNGYGGWSGRAILSDADWPFELELSSPQARFFQLYSPEEGGIFVAEPVTHANAALNAPEEDWRSLGMRVLEPGETMELAARIAVEPRQGLG
jgi:aldose 1-epimerase